MTITKNTPYEQLEFPQKWRLKKYLAPYNERVDLDSRILTVNDLKKADKEIMKINGIGYGTYLKLKVLLEKI